MITSVNYRAAPKRVPPVGVAFLLSQVGAHAASCFEERLAAMELKPHHAGLLRMLGSNPGLSQQELCDVFGIFPSRLVVLLEGWNRTRPGIFLYHPSRRQTPMPLQVFLRFVEKWRRRAVIANRIT